MKNEEFNRMQKLAGLNEIKVNAPGGKLSQVINQIKSKYPEIVDDGEVETGTDDWFDLMSLVVKVFTGEDVDMFEIEDISEIYTLEMGTTLEKALEKLNVEMI